MLVAKDIEVALKTLHAKRVKLNELLASASYREKIKTRDYGCHDPRDVDLALCECGSTPLVSRKSSRWIVSCPQCPDRATKASSRKWGASLNWNLANSDRITYQSIIHFDLPYRSPDESKVRLESIKQDLATKCDLAEIEARISAMDNNFRAPGGQYHDKLRAYLKWAELGLIVLNRELSESRG